MNLNRVERRPELLPLTGIRAFAAWWVVLFHVAYILPSLSPALYWLARLGFLGVDLFFVLSGFIISYNYWHRFSTFSLPMYRSFLRARLARLYPVHIFTLIVSALLLLIIRVSGRATVKDFSTWTQGNFLANVAMVHAWRPHFVESWNNASWSVSWC
jgi:peptidoglycan/LPS O-acetylase OafA/YrhL